MKFSSLALVFLATVEGFSGPAMRPAALSGCHRNHESSNNKKNSCYHWNKSFDRRHATTLSYANGATNFQQMVTKLEDLEKELGTTADDDQPANHEQIEQLLEIVNGLVVATAATNNNNKNQDAAVDPLSTLLHDNADFSKKSNVLKLIDTLLLPKPSLEEVRVRAGLSVHDKDTIESLLEFRGRVFDNLDKISSTEDDFEYAQYPPHPEYPEVSLANMPKLRKDGVTTPPPLEYCFSLGRMLTTLKRISGFMIGMRLNAAQVAAAKTARERTEAWFSPAKVFGLPNPLRGLVQKPERLIREYMKDEEFARHYLAGPNPISIRVCKNPTEQLTPQLLTFFERQGIDVERIGEEKRLLFADYKELLAAKDNPRSAYPRTLNPDVPESDDNLRYFEAPIVVLELHPNRHDANVLAIQLKRDVEDAEVYSKATCSEAEWYMAKSMAACADGNIHEFLDHFFETHLAFEAQVLAIHNTLRKYKHPLWDFFKPLTKDALFMNYTGRNMLFTSYPRSFADEFISVGTGQLSQLIQNRWREYDFFVNAHLPNELRRRGFDDDFDLPGYLFREDGLKIWEALGEFTTNFVNEVYLTDQHVANDIVLQLWANEMTDPSKAAVPGFPTAFQDKATLALTLQCIWWVVSALHNVHNASQFDYYSFPPARPLSLRMNMEMFKEKGDDTLDFIFENVLPGDAGQANTMLTTHALTLPSDVHLDDLTGHYSKTKYGLKSYKRLLRRLSTITESIQRRNEELELAGKPAFNVMDPSCIAAGPDI